MAKKLYVKNFPFSTTEESIKDLFAEFGAVGSVKIIVDAQTGQSRGFGFVEMESDSDAQRAVAALNGKNFMGRTLTVAEAKPQQSKYGYERKREPTHRH